ncbi:MAG: DUF6504 family protein [Arachnia sp.]
MRTYDEPICVLFSDHPQQFIWRNRLMLVKEVQGRWSRSTAWWESQRVSAARGDAVPNTSAGTDLAPAADLLEEMEVWRVEAGNGVQRGVYELARSMGREDWVLQAVCD